MNRNQRLWMQDERLQDLQGSTEQHLVHHLRHALGTDLQAARREHAAAKRTCRRPSNEGIERARRLENPGADLGNLQRTRTGVPDQDLHARSWLHVLGFGKLASGPENGGGRECVDERPLDYPSPEDVFDALLVRRRLLGKTQERRQPNIGTRGSGAQPREEDIGALVTQERSQALERLG